jgi:hypothetical protein
MMEKDRKKKKKEIEILDKIKSWRSQSVENPNSTN